MTDEGITEEEWLASQCPGWMLAVLGDKKTERKVSLYWLARPTWGARHPEEAGDESAPKELGTNLEHQASDALLIREVFGNPFRPVSLDLNWLTTTVTRLAESIYADRAFDRLPVLADALEEAGCDNADVLAHCRGPGPHVRGCWVVDLILGKS